MYRVLVTTTIVSANGQGCSVHTVVIECGLESTAHSAIAAINNTQDLNYEQKAIALF